MDATSAIQRTMQQLESGSYPSGLSPLETQLAGAGAIDRTGAGVSRWS